MSILKSVALGAFFLAGVTTAVAAAPMISDASFETPSVPGSYDYNPTVAGVTFAGSSGVQANGSAFGYANAPDGTQTAHLQNTSSISFDVAGLVVGDRYTISFFDAQRPNYDTLPISVTFDGTTIVAATTPTFTAFGSVMSDSFVASAVTGTLIFSSDTVGGDHNTAVDGITFSGGTAPVPEPASLALLALGLGGLGMVARSRR